MALALTAKQVGTTTDEKKACGRMCSPAGFVSE